MVEQPPQSKMMVLLFTDVVGSVDLRTRLGDERAAALLSRHDEIFHDLLKRSPSGEELLDTGDGFLARFATVSDAVSFALKFQYALHKEAWGENLISVRIGLHLGEVFEYEHEGPGAGKISGLAVDIASRVVNLAIGAQILMTRAAFDNARQFVREHPMVDGTPGGRPPLTWMAHGQYVFKGSDDPLEIYEVGVAGIAPLREPPNTDKAKRAVRAGEEETLGWRPGVGLEVPGRPGWVLDDRLGEGGFGEVWLARHTKTKVRRAFKFCFDVDRLRSLKRELTLFRLLREVLGDRPDIARLYEVRLDEAPYFLECEFTELGNLHDWAESRGGLKNVSMAARLDMMIRTVRALAAAHSVGVLHKDIKPSNILIYEAEDREARPRLADFGIGVLTDPKQLEGRDITVAGFTDLLEGNESYRTGTRMYSPPESMIGKPFTVQGDIYALGVMLYQMVAGDLDRPLAQGWERDVEDPLLREDISLCVAGDESQRLTSAQELADRLQNLPARRRARQRRRVARASALSSGILAVLLVLAGFMILRERQARVRIEREAEISKSQLAWIGGMFSDINPRSGAGKDVKVADTIEKAVQSLDEQFKDKPEVKAALLRYLGNAYFYLSLYEDAEPLLDEALRMQRSLDTVNAREIAQTEADLARVRWWLHDYESVRDLAQHSLELRVEAHGTDHDDVATSMTYLAAALGKLNRPDEAEARLREALEIRRRLHGTNHSLVAAAMNNLAENLRDQGQYAQAQELFEGARDIARNISIRQGKPSLNYATTLNNLAHVLAFQPDSQSLDEAVRIYRQALQIKEEDLKLGTDSSVAITLQRLAELQFCRSEFDDARNFAERARTMLETIYGSDDPRVAESLAVLALIHKSDGDLAKAEELRDRVIRILNDHEQTGSPQIPARQVVELLRAHGETARANEIAQFFQQGASAN